MTRKITVNLTDKIETWRNATNTMSGYVGEPDNLTTTNKTDLVQAINEIKASSGSTYVTTALSLVAGGNGSHTTLSYDSNSGLFSFNCSSISPSHLDPLPASVITSGTFTTTRIPNLPTTKITTGVFNKARIPVIHNLDGLLKDSQVGFTTSHVPEGSPNLYFTDSRARGAFSTDSDITLDSNGKIGLTLSAATLASINNFNALGGTGVTIGSSDSISIGQEVDSTSSVTFNTINSAAITSTGGITATTGTFSGALSGASITGDMIADSFEADSGLLNNLIMTPLQVKRQISTDVSGKLVKKYVSSYVGISNSGQNVFTHGLGVEPDIITYRLKCITAQNGYSVNDIIDIHPSTDNDGPEQGFGAVVNNAHITIRIASSGPGIYQDKHTGGTSVLKATNWQLQVRAFIIA